MAIVYCLRWHCENMSNIPFESNLEFTSTLNRFVKSNHLAQFGAMFELLLHIKSFLLRSNFTLLFNILVHCHQWPHKAIKNRSKSFDVAMVFIVEWRVIKTIYIATAIIHHSISFSTFTYAYAHAIALVH